MKALYPGSFDPPHLGHLDLIRRAAVVSSHLVVGIGVNPEKTPFLPPMRRCEILRAECAGMRNVEVVLYSGATVHWATGHGIQAMVRGLRSAQDLEAEAQMAIINRSFGFETLFLLSNPALAHISSRLIRQVLAAKLPADGLLPARVVDAIRISSTH